MANGGLASKNNQQAGAQGNNQAKLIQRKRAKVLNVVG
jgi:hypothetical protein